MDTRWVATLLISVGYTCAAWGAVLTWRSSPPDRGFGTIPRLSSADADAYFAQQRADIDARKRNAHHGLILLIIGTLLQLAGSLLGIFQPSRWS